MTKIGKLQFDLTDKVAKVSFKRAVKADDLVLCLWRINDLIFDDKCPEHIKISISKIMCDYNIDITELTQ